MVRHEAALWGSAIIAPIQRGEAKVRPIALTEALVKLAEGTALDCIATSLQAVLEPHQLSVRTAGAVEALVRPLRRWTRRWPDMTLVELDLSNAYGNALHGAMLRATRQRCPSMAAALAASVFEIAFPHWVCQGETGH